MKVKAAAKINLMLDVVGVLPNGYHSLYMIMQSVDCYDYVRVDRTENSGIKIITADPRVPTDEKNIAYKAAKAFFDKTGICENNGIEIEIEKHIPMAEVPTVQALFLHSTSYLTQIFPPLSCVKSAKKWVPMFRFQFTAERHCAPI